MSVIVVGVNHRTVPLPLLERMTVDAVHVPKVLTALRDADALLEAVLLSTCNRTEVYARAVRFHDAVGAVRDVLADHAGLPPEDVSDHLYSHYEDRAVAHLFSVASGLDSAVLGESEILGQVKEAWELARDEGACGSGLHLLFRHAVEAGKRARTETAIGRHIASVSQAAVAMATERLGSLAGRTVVVLGAGGIGAGMATAIAGSGVAEVLVANRSAERARALAQEIGGRPVDLAELPGVLAHADVLLTSTGAPSHLVAADDVRPAMAARPERPMLIVDVAVPRDVDPSAADLPGVTLLDMDDVRAFVDAGLAGRRREVSAVRGVVEEEVERYLATAAARQAAPLVAALRQRAERIRSDELARLEPRLADLEPDERAAVEDVLRRVVQKLLHEPTVRLKDAAGTPHGDQLADSVRHLFDL